MIQLPLFSLHIVAKYQSYLTLFFYEIYYLTGALFFSNHFEQCSEFFSNELKGEL